MAGADWPEAVTTHTFHPLDGSAAEFWSISSFYARDDVAPVIDATGGSIRVGELGPGSGGLRARIGWHVRQAALVKRTRTMDCLGSAAVALFVGGVGDVRALDVATGELRWSVNLSTARSVTELALGEDFINVIPFISVSSVWHR